MKKGYLSSYFKGVATKNLTEVEVNPNKSNQHEFNGVAKLKSLFGQETQKIPAKFLYFNDDDPIIDEGFVTWYESRGGFYEVKGKERFRSEYRLYYPTTEVSNRMTVGDLFLLAKCNDDTVLVIIAEAESTAANQLLWLFGMTEEVNPKFSVRESLETEQDRLSFTSELILEMIGIEVSTTDDNFLDYMLQRFDNKFPTTRMFSLYARETLAKDIFPLDNPDEALMRWMEREEVLFRTFERYLLAERLQKGFAKGDKDVDVDGFISFSLSVQNRRKSRVGQALENHMEAIFKEHKIKHDRGKQTENKSKPDFLFPGQKEYKDVSFPVIRLAMLGVKSTCKDRWRQVLSEADRIPDKHLLTLEPSISENQTKEMETRKLQLVIPQSLFSTYSILQQSWLMNVSEFIDLVKSKQTMT